MPSPFPGKNPWLEQPGAWHDFHEQFIMECRALLVRNLGERYFARLDEHVYIHELSGEERRFLGRADIALGRQSGDASASEASTATLSAPHVGRVVTAVDIERESFIEIRDRQSRRVITIIELLSPSNKRPGSDREQYLGKRREILNSDVHFVEMDLLRGEPRMPIEDLPVCDYCIMVSRYEDRPDVGLWPVGLRDPMPEIPVPLIDVDEIVRLDLQSAMRSAFEAAAYDRYIYDESPDPPLSAADADWAAQFLPTAKS